MIEIKGTRTSNECGAGCSDYVGVELQLDDDGNIVYCHVSEADGVVYYTIASESVMDYFLGNESMPAPIIEQYNAMDNDLEDENDDMHNSKYIEFIIKANDLYEEL